MSRKRNTEDPYYNLTTYDRLYWSYLFMNKNNKEITDLIKRVFESKGVNISEDHYNNDLYYLFNITNN